MNATSKFVWKRISLDRTRRCHHLYSNDNILRLFTGRRRFHSSSSTTNPDYIVVGAGSAGCVVASRLVEAGKTVTLLEAGHSDRGAHFRDFFLYMPTALAWPMSSPRYNWAFPVQPEPTLNNRIISCPRGKGLGGSSSINGMVYVRGHPENFNDWQRSGATGWNYEHVLPYFTKAEYWAHKDDDNDKDDDDDVYRGDKGPLHVKNGDNAANTPLYELFQQAGDQAGYGRTDDYNGRRQEGFGPMAMTVFHSGPLKGMRCSTSSAYLHPTLKKHPDKIHVKTQILTEKIIFDTPTATDKPTATGVMYTDLKTNTRHTLSCNEEVIVCAGSIQSPQLLQISGIGDKDHLQKIGVDSIVHHNPNVGRNLQDHVELYFQQEVNDPVSIAPILNSYWEQFRLGLEWVVTRQGLGATNQFEAAAFVRSSPQKRFPDVQFHFLPVGVSYDGVTVAPSRTGHSLQIHVGTSASASRGHVLATSPCASDVPYIRFNYMSRPEDWIDMKAAIEIARQILRQPALQGIVGDEILPGSDTDLDEYIREHVESAYHPCGTCKMGDSQDDHDAVVDSSGQVHGVTNLRVVDASIFPTITNGNLNAPVIMVAERMSDLILGRDPLPAVQFTTENAPWIPPSNGTDRERDPLVP
ncbi:choline dehydrogenase [Nitzschia inconspicua]|uniref:Choline dehydrogenase n=1 Tax=Nitzschia inconspicua TaxID=303405 RepID=A0A9K3KKI1_9STRA|nr:choline dehydrogenase [Nitzschia inconspicua]